tara:strand:+ start:74 stop:367 length:294 start_codon:yes stop_codon:yes gene_type:complete
MKYKFLIIIFLFFTFSACSGVGGKRSEKSDEFLIEKKNPLVMPPDIDDLPKPQDSPKEKIKENNFKETLKSKSTSNDSIKNENSGSLQESIIKKIEQ